MPLKPPKDVLDLAHRIGCVCAYLDAVDDSRAKELLIAQLGDALPREPRPHAVNHLLDKNRWKGLPRRGGHISVAAPWSSAGWTPRCLSRRSSPGNTRRTSAF